MVYISFSTRSITPKIHTPEIVCIPWNVSVQMHGWYRLKIYWCPSYELLRLHMFAFLPPSTENRLPREERTWFNIICPRVLFVFKCTQSTSLCLCSIPVLFLFSSLCSIKFEITTCALKLNLNHKDLKSIWSMLDIHSTNTWCCLVQIKGT